MSILSCNRSKNKLLPLSSVIPPPPHFFFSSLGDVFNFSALQVQNQGRIKIFPLEFFFHTQTEYSMQFSSSNCYSCTNLFSCLYLLLKHARCHECQCCWGPLNGLLASRFSAFASASNCFFKKHLFDHLIFFPTKQG